MMTDKEIFAFSDCALPCDSMAGHYNCDTYDADCDNSGSKPRSGICPGFDTTSAFGGSKDCGASARNKRVNKGCSCNHWQIWPVGFNVMFGVAVVLASTSFVVNCLLGFWFCRDCHNTCSVP